jgi:hypothetical protein
MSAIPILWQKLIEVTWIAEMKKLYHVVITSDSVLLHFIVILVLLHFCFVDHRRTLFRIDVRAI